jgi:hypothetical protein
VNRSINADLWEAAEVVGIALLSSRRETSSELIKRPFRNATSGDRLSQRREVRRRFSPSNQNGRWFL